MKIEHGISNLSAADIAFIQDLIKTELARAKQTAVIKNVSLDFSRGYPQFEILSDKPVPATDGGWEIDHAQTAKLSD